jgi:transcriptional regulator with XRE-family HTH domain
LAKKLKAIREELGLGQLEMSRRLSKLAMPLDRAKVSKFERGEREPNLIEIVAYCHMAQIDASVLIDDRWTVKDLVYEMKKR